MPYLDFLRWKDMYVRENMHIGYSLDKWTEAFSGFALIAFSFFCRRLKEIFFRMKVSVNTAICSGQFGMTVLQTVFMFYYVKVFLNIFKINEIWFDIAQLLFMVWNSVNDPLFGYLQVALHP